MTGRDLGLENLLYGGQISFAGNQEVNLGHRFTCHTSVGSWPSLVKIAAAHLFKQSHSFTGMTI